MAAAPRRLNAGRVTSGARSLALAILQFGHVFLILQSAHDVGGAALNARLRFPERAAAGRPLRLFCDYLLGDERLYAFKMLKDGQEFYKWTPQHGGVQFSSPGVNVELSASNDRSVQLVGLTPQTAGAFKCSITVEGTFKSTISMERKLEVLERALPTASGNQLANAFTSGSGSASARQVSQQQHRQQQMLILQQQQQRAIQQQQLDQVAEKGRGQPQGLASGATRRRLQRSSEWLLLTLFPMVTSVVWVVY